jgi:hypothetical protein
MPLTVCKLFFLWKMSPVRLNLSRVYQAAFDLLTSMINSHNVDTTVPFAFNLEVGTRWCPKVLLNSGADTNCTRASTFNPVTFSPDNQTVSLSLSMGSTGALSISYYVQSSTLGNAGPIHNLLQFMHAAVRLDLGYELPNNILTNSSVASDPNVGSGGSVYQALSPGGWVSYPIPSVNESAINTSFQCSYKVLNSWPQVILSVFIATFTLLSTG